MFLLIDKPKGITSHDVIYRLRKITGIKKIGHAGTLDPNATGLLIVGIGRESTKKLGSLTKDTCKEYIADIVLGEERDTHDSEGIVTKSSKLNNKKNMEILRLPMVALDDNVGGEIVPTLSNVKSVLKLFTGEIEQVPPKHSAIKIKGKKAYELARKGKEVKLKPRKVTIHSIEVLEYKYPFLKIKTSVSSGTYIRALARDIGRELGTYGYLGELRRTAISKYAIDKSLKLDDLNTDDWKKYTIEI